MHKFPANVFIKWFSKTLRAIKKLRNFESRTERYGPVTRSTPPSFSEESRKLALLIFALELAHTAVVSIGRYDPSLKFYQRTLSLQSRLPGFRLPIQFQSEAPVQARAEVAT